MIRLLRKLFVLPIRIWQRAISPLFPPTCRYSPTCSQYAIEAVHAHGVIKGSLLAIWRVLRCHPFASGGFDPVPPRRRQAAPPSER